MFLNLDFKNLMHIIAGTHKSRKIFSPKGDQTRPTSSKLREALFNICQQRIRGADFLDLFAGSGAMGLEALSRGARSAAFVEQDRHAFACIHRNLEALEMGAQGIVYQGDVLKVLKNIQISRCFFDVIYADPPYGKKIAGDYYSTRLLQEIDRSALLAQGGIFFIEESDEWNSKEVSLEKLTLMEKRRFGDSHLYSFGYRKEV